MIKLIFEKDSPSGQVLINLPELKILKWINYSTNFTFHKSGIFEQKISEIEQHTENKDKILIIVNDNSNHPYIKRSFICIYSENELRS